ncbi:hypothetical protein AB9Q10_05420 [Streptomyces krungchingensis]|uniref:hypothetical protein n=1 Tax=Streptomyces krungchingensis TaxID=1565034 RepID=UPI003CF8CB37
MSAGDEQVPTDDILEPGTDERGTPDGRRSRRTVLSIAAATLLLLGGAGYGVLRASGNGSPGSGAASPDARPADAGRNTPAARPTDAGRSAPAAPSAGAGQLTTPLPVRIVYHLEGALPRAPRSAPLYRADRKVTEAETARLARALGVTGVRDQGDFWSNPPSGELIVQKDQWGAWGYGKRPDKSTRLVDEDRAKAAALPVLKALGQTDSTLATAPAPENRRRVTADPMIDGLPTSGWTTELSVDGDGRVTSATGFVGLPRRIGEAPVTSSRTALTRTGAQFAGPGVPSEVPGTETRHVTIRSVRLILTYEPCPAKGARLAPAWEVVGWDPARPEGRWFEEAVPPEDPSECL